MLLVTADDGRYLTPSSPVPTGCISSATQVITDWQNVLHVEPLKRTHCADSGQPVALNVLRIQGEAAVIATWLVSDEEAGREPGETINVIARLNFKNYIINRHYLYTF